MKLRQNLKLSYLGLLIIIATLGCMQKSEIKQPIFPSQHEEVKVIEIKRLTYDEAQDTSPTWNPDGKQIAFASKRTGSYRIWVMDADGSNLRILDPKTLHLSGYENNPSWSKRGIVFESSRAGNLDIWLMDSEGNSVRLTADEDCDALTCPVDMEPSWSPDGKWIAFASADEPMKFDIWITKVDGSPTICLTTNESIDRYPRWKGNEIVFTSTRSGGGDIYVLKLKFSS